MSKQKQIINYHSNLKQKSRNLRKQGPLAEIILWKKLKAGQLSGYKFLRQKPIGTYIVDFFCRELKLIIEIDGYSHKDKFDYDQKRDEYFKKLNLSIIHFQDKDVLNKIDDIISDLENFIKDHCQNANIPLTPFKGGVEKYISYK